MNNHWAKEAIFYHIYPLGLCDAPAYNDVHAPVEQRLDRLYPWLAHAQSMGFTALYLGPVFQSATHGYDTVDYYQVDKRLGDNPALSRLSEAVHLHGMRLVLDGVFNHVGRDFWAFRDVLEKGETSAYVDWFHNLRFGETSPKGDPFRYEGWHGHDDLVKLNLAHPQVRSHLFDAVGMWMNQFQIDGLRLDAADCIDVDFLQSLHRFVMGRNADFWLMGEVVHGDYRNWANPHTLDSVTNYECYKGLFSSLNEGNYFEIAYSLDRQFGEQGLYKEMCLYNFVDNHDVDRVASKLTHSGHLFPLYILLYSMPGIPSVYYGSEWGLQGVKGKHTDAPLRPTLNIDQMVEQAPQPNLPELIRNLGQIRNSSSALRHGDYQALLVDHRQFAFMRQTPDETIVVMLNSASEPVEIELNLPGGGRTFVDLLEPGEPATPREGKLSVTLPPNGGKMLHCGHLHR